MSLVTLFLFKKYGNALTIFQMQLSHDIVLDQKPEPAEKGDRSERKRKRRISQCSFIWRMVEVRVKPCGRRSNRGTQIHHSDLVRLDRMPWLEIGRDKTWMESGQALQTRIRARLNIRTQRGSQGLPSGSARGRVARK
jgi:hypothetical protein